MNKSELIDNIATNAGLSKKVAKETLNAFIDAVTESAAKDEDVSLPGFGTFKLKHNSSRQGRNPQTGESLTIPASKSVTFKAGAQLKAAVNK